jgi:hypothetical protein
VVAVLLAMLQGEKKSTRGERKSVIRERRDGRRERTYAKNVVKI